MKTHKIVSAALLAIASASLASAAATPINIASGQAFRGAVTAAIINTLSNSTAGYSGTSLATATQSVIQGYLKSGPSAGQEVVYRILWSGSNAGIQSAAQISPVVTKTLPSETNTLSAVTVNGTAGSYTFSGGTQFSSPATVTAQVDATPGINS